MAVKENKLTAETQSDETTSAGSFKNKVTLWRIPKNLEKNTSRNQS